MEYTRDDLRIGDLLAPEFIELLDQKRASEARDALLDLLDPQIADVLIALPAQPMAVIFRLLPRNRAANEIARSAINRHAVGGVAQAARAGNVHANEIALDDVANSTGAGDVNSALAVR